LSDSTNPIVSSITIDFWCVNAKSGIAVADLDPAASSALRVSSLSLVPSRRAGIEHHPHVDAAPSSRQARSAASSGR
jgi:hypothetical protein